MITESELFRFSGLEFGPSKYDVRRKRSMITDGRDAKQGAWPWQVSLQLWNSDLQQFEHQCGGSIINDRYILTAAHCFIFVDGAMDPKNWQVVAGEHELFTEKDGPVDIYNISRIILHELAQADTLTANDIALLEMTEPIQFSDNVNAILLAERGVNYEQEAHCYATGWGTNEEDFLPHVAILQEVHGVIPRHIRCRQWWSGENLNRKMTSMFRYQFDDNLPATNICFGRGHKGTCTGDSGGPLVCRVDKKWRLVGVTSRGTSPCINNKFGKGLPSLSMKVSAFLPWIAKNSALLSVTDTNSITLWKHSMKR